MGRVAPFASFSSQVTLASDCLTDNTGLWLSKQIILTSDWLQIGRSRACPSQERDSSTSSARFTRPRSSLVRRGQSQSTAGEKLQIKVKTEFFFKIFVCWNSCEAYSPGYPIPARVPGARAAYKDISPRTRKIHNIQIFNQYWNRPLPCVSK